MRPVISIGAQDFEKLRMSKAFYIDKTDFIREWWENGDVVTLLTRPRRFGKTLNMSMLECFFSKKYAGRKELFEGLSIWKDEKYRGMQGNYPVVSFSFAEIKAKNFQDAREGIIAVLRELYMKHDYLLQSGCLAEEEKQNYKNLGQYVEKTENPMTEITDTTIARAVKQLMIYMTRYYGQKVIVLLDEYDTPLQEAYVRGYWRDMTDLIRGMFNSTFKTNEYIDRGILTGITRVSKESIFSDLNNLKVVNTTTDKYCTAFGFTEEEVFQALKDRNLAEEMEHIRSWYDGFVFGSKSGIYNPWSITSFLDSEEYGTYWADTSSNILVSELIKTGTPEIKMQMEKLLAGESLEVQLDEQIIFEQLKKKKGAIWSLLIASGYLKPAERVFSQKKGRFIYKLQITNHETELMFRDMISAWFPEELTSYGNFKKALLMDDLDYMNQYMNQIALKTFSSFDTGKKPSEDAEPERFYHGFVLGLIVDLADEYRITSNRESGLGRYDVMMEPLDKQKKAVVMEFKVYNPAKEADLNETVKNALWQIQDKKYDMELLAKGISKENIRHYGFAFQGKKVLIGQEISEK